MARIALVGGYTAGHVLPMLAVADAFRAQDPTAEVLLVGGRNSLEAALIRSRGRDCFEIDGAPLYGVTTWSGRLRSCGAFLRGLLQSRRLLARQRVDLALGFGGYITAGPMLAARTLGIATAIFEANVVPGRANRLVQRWMDARLLGFSETSQAPGWRASELVGYPLRTEIAALARASRTAPAGRVARLIVTGGSRGSPFLNRMAPPLLGELVRRGIPIDVLHQTGLEPTEPVARAYGAEQIPAVVEAFTEDVAQAYARADLVICAAGAGTLAEVAALGLPSLIVPMSSVADDHQTANARAFASRTGASSVREAEWAQSRIADWLARTLQDAETWSRASERMRSAAQPGAAAAIVSACERLLGLRRGDPHEPLTALPRRSAKP